MSYIFDTVKRDMLTSGQNWGWNHSAVNLYMMLVSGSYAGTNNLEFESDVTAWEVVDASYSRQAVPVANRTITLTTGTNLCSFDAADVTFSSINNVTVGGAILFDSGGGSPGANRLFCYLSGSGFPVTCNGGDLTIQFATAGVFTISGS